MKAPNIQTTEKVVPMIYAYTTPGITYHDGYIKIGYTEQDVDTRIKQQTHTAGVMAKKEWQGTAIYDDGSGEAFLDHDFHSYLRANGIEQPQDKGNEFFDPKDRNEWFYTSPTESKGMFYDFKANRGVISSPDAVVPYVLRKEQEEAVAKTFQYRKIHEGGEFLWNAKPRFGKTLSAYDFCTRIGAQNVLIVTNRPAIANSWYEDYVQFIGQKNGYYFVSEVDALKGREFVLSRDQYRHLVAHADDSDDVKCIEFVSLQDMKGSIYFGGQYNKLAEISDKAGITWDVLIIDEAHEGVDTYKTDVAFEHVKRRFTLHLSGTPFKAMANSKFPSDAIFNWTYADEQQARLDWEETALKENPYAVLPRINLYTYQMSEIIRDQLEQGIEIQGETEEYAFDLNEFFSTVSAGNGVKFKYNASVDKFLDALTIQKKFPFSTPELRDELKHTFWLLNRVDSAKALADAMTEIGERCGRHIYAFITDMNEPLGHCVGNSLEVLEAVEVLRGEGEERLTKLCLELSKCMLIMSDVMGRGDYRDKELRDKAEEMILDAVKSGKALDKFREFVRSQGGDDSFVDNPMKLKQPKFAKDVKVCEAGYLAGCNAEEVGNVSCVLGAGRLTKSDSIDSSAGIRLYKKLGDKVDSGEVIATLYTDKKYELSEAEERFLKAYTISENKIETGPVIL